MLCFREKEPKSVRGRKESHSSEMEEGETRDSDDEDKENEKTKNTRSPNKSVHEKTRNGHGDDGSDSNSDSGDNDHRKIIKKDSKEKEKSIGKEPVDYNALDYESAGSDTADVALVCVHSLTCILLYLLKVN